MTISLRTCWRVLASILLVVLLGTSIFAGWFFFYRRDLPDMETLGAFAPVNVVRLQTVDACGQASQVWVLPSQRYGAGS